MNVCLLKGRGGGDPRFPYMAWFGKAWENAGGAVCLDVRLPHKMRAAFGHAGLAFSTGIRRGRLLVCGGHRIESVAWPWCYFHEIVPVMWDVWPECFEPLVKFIRRNKVKLVFCTSSQQVEHLKERVPGLNAVWLPEGIDVASYPNGNQLVDRPIDVLEYGRRMDSVHKDLVEYSFSHKVNHVYQKGTELLFPDFESMTAGIRSAKISICYPQCDTKPWRAGNVETLTQRYWEAMLSGTLLAGRAPKELIDFCGYNPVITLGDHPAQQIEDVLDHIGDYQELADRNRKFAVENADWSKRIPIVMRALQDNG